MRLALTLTACLLAASALAQEIRVIDGDTFEMDGETIRLWGIDAPELGQTCQDHDGRTVEVGELARLMLQTILKNLDHCDRVGADTYGQAFAICATTQDLDVGTLMIGLGWALEHPRYIDGLYSDTTRIAEDQATTPLYRGQCISPWLWRALN